MGCFTVNLGVYIPEVAALHGGGPAKGWIQAYNCAIRSRLGSASGRTQDLWWHVRNDAHVIADVQSLLMAYGLLFLDRFESRDKVLSDLAGHGENLEYCSVPRIISAIILTKRGQAAAATELMAAQAGEALNRNHAAYVRELAIKMGLGEI